MRRVPAILLSAALLANLAGCESAPEPAGQTRRHFTNDAQKNYADNEFAVYDPAQPVNKEIYKFNAKLDEYLLLPVVNAYVYVTPEFLRSGVSNFFLNVGEVNNFTNAVLQIKPVKASKTLVRFAVNTTVGLLGTLDVATRIGVERQPDDFGKTLGYWGVGSGAYVVLPFLGPSNLRDTAGLVVDYATLYFIIPDNVQDTAAYDVVAYGLQPIDMRYDNNFRYYASGSPFEYELVRYIVTQTRAADIAKLKGQN